MNRLRGERVLVDLHPVKNEKKDPYKETGSGIYIPEEETTQKRDMVEIREATVLKVGHLIHPQDLKEGMTVYVKPFQGERVSPDNEHYLFKERDVIGND